VIKPQRWVARNAKITNPSSRAKREPSDFCFPFFARFTAAIDTKAPLPGLKGVDSPEEIPFGDGDVSGLSFSGDGWDNRFPTENGSYRFVD